VKKATSNTAEAALWKPARLLQRAALQAIRSVIASPRIAV
jgi:hypothetical protein